MNEIGCALENCGVEINLHEVILNSVSDYNKTSESKNKILEAQSKHILKGVFQEFPDH